MSHHLADLRAAHDAAEQDRIARTAFDALALQRVLESPDVFTTARVTFVAGGKAYEVTGARACQGGCIVLLTVEKIG